MHGWHRGQDFTPDLAKRRAPRVRVASLPGGGNRNPRVRAASSGDRLK